MNPDGLGVLPLGAHARVRYQNGMLTELLATILRRIAAGALLGLMLSGVPARAQALAVAGPHVATQPITVLR